MQSSSLHLSEQISLPWLVSQPKIKSFCSLGDVSYDGLHLDISGFYTGHIAYKISCKFLQSTRFAAICFFLAFEVVVIIPNVFSPLVSEFSYFQPYYLVSSSRKEGKLANTLIFMCNLIKYQIIKQFNPSPLIKTKCLSRSQMFFFYNSFQMIIV